MEQKEIDTLKNEVALFRYGLIAPVVTGIYSHSSMMAYFREVAEKSYTIKGKEISISPETVKSWYRNYKKSGYEALLPKTRSDNKKSRKLSEQTIQQIYLYKEKFPHISGTLIYTKLYEDGFINEDEISLSTILKYIRDNKTKFNETENIDRRAFVMEHSNDCWQADTSNGPYIMIDNKRTLTYLIAIIDDASRLVVGAKFFFNDNAVNLQTVLKSSIKKYGVPKRLFVDNGKTYKNEQLAIICANVGLVLIHARPYSGASKGKIERFFHTMKATWMRGLDWNEIKSIDELNDKLLGFINEYNNNIHSSLENLTPKSRWFQDEQLIKKISNDDIDTYFLHTAYPTIRSDAIAYIKSNEFEVNMKYIGKKIEVKYDPNDFTKAWISEENKLIEEIKLVNKVDNSKIKRKNTMY